MLHSERVGKKNSFLPGWQFSPIMRHQREFCQPRHLLLCSMLKARRQEKRPGAHRRSRGGETTEEGWLAVGQGSPRSPQRCSSEPPGSPSGSPLGSPPAQGSADALGLLFQPYPHLSVNHSNEADSVGMVRKRRYYL